ncbi:MAG: hypothetical protein ABEI86_08375, partial [Halobacteriaceae archaeon]
GGLVLIDPQRRFHYYIATVRYGRTSLFGFSSFGWSLAMESQSIRYLFFTIIMRYGFSRDLLTMK